MHILHIHCIYTFYVQHKELYTGHSMWTCGIYTHTMITLYNTIYIYVYIYIDTNNMGLTVHCICTGGIHIFLILHWYIFSLPKHHQVCLCFKFHWSGGTRSMSCNEVLPQRASAGIVQTLSSSTGKQCGESSFLYGK